ncbi:hypothetical protein C5Y96_21440 [Blastopirellula marina]|uniref:Agenet-like domain-containing protein n=1 Tax=Blastopirellula marina TaxID=124 RepID=A0A2S8F1H0_9BACT|nr:MULTISPECIES: hypothetical protein [Pirellulaceae]PQO26018.1 hypothetical protein C5Y96_21440 [Blastopirellula marina]RCS44376.1 hypothetical protein DTL36_21485 [Bremerella cremea]
MSILRYSVTAAFSLTAIVMACAAAHAQNINYATNQSNYTFKSKHGNFEFTGKALKREGEYVLFRNTDRTEIWMPVKHLSSETLAYLKYLNGEGPAPTGITALPMNDSTTGPATGAMANNSAGGTSTDNGTSTPMDTKPADPGKGDPDKIYTPGTPIDVLVDSKWYPGKVFARRPSDNAYFVSYSVDGRPKSAWIPAVELRPQGGEQPMTDSPMTDEPMTDKPTEEAPTTDDTTSGDLPSFTGKQVTVTAKDPVGYVVGPVHKGDVISLQYVSGKWKTWGGIASASPDDENVAGGDKCRMGICALFPNNDLQKLTLVPGLTVNNPFSWTADKDYEKIILQVNDDDGDFASNPDKDVTYAMSIERAAAQ